MKHVAEMVSGTMIGIPSFIETGLGIQKLLEGRHRHTDAERAWRLHKPNFLFQNKGSRLISGAC
jgi:hypothetical protein